MILTVSRSELACCIWLFLLLDVLITIHRKNFRKNFDMIFARAPNFGGGCNSSEVKPFVGWGV